MLKLAGVLLMLAWASTSNAALIFDFEINDGNATVVTGEILGLEDNSTNIAATSVRVLSAFGNIVDMEFVFNPLDPDYLNMFSVSAGQITFMDLLSRFDGVITQELFLRGNPGNFGGYYYEGELNGVLQIIGTGGVTFAARDVPAPGAFILLALGIAGLSFARYKKNA
jgi:hypothetical protein